MAPHGRRPHLEEARGARSAAAPGGMKVTVDGADGEGGEVAGTGREGGQEARVGGGFIGRRGGWVAGALCGSEVGR